MIDRAARPADNEMLASVFVRFSCGNGSMDSAGLSTYPEQAPPYQRRFGWGMRLFLTFMVFWMCFRCLAVLLPMSLWSRRYQLATLPKPLPTAAERAALWQNAAADKALDPVVFACLESAVDVLKFCNPKPNSATLERIKTPLDGVLYTAVWLNSRLDFLERLAGVHEEWIMFAPNVPIETVFLRARLIFDDDTEIVVRQLSEPADLTKGGHGWLEERVTNHEYWAYEFSSSCWGYCNLLAHRHPLSDKGVPLKWIVLLYAATDRAPPGADALAHYQEQNRLTATPPRIPNTYRSQTIKGETTQIHDFYLYTVKTRGGKQL